ncbi:hypothetical protein DI272_17570 [Streptomyces sp. Act143]|nr:hypothetical protein DI272_17570 [Streptomyces sp. Act143]
MILKRITRTAAVLAATVGLGVGLAAPASASAASPTAALATTWWDGAEFQAQVDNRPGNGSESWLWLADYRHRDGLGAIAHVKYYGDNTSYGWGPPEDGTSEVGLSRDVSQFPVCEFGNQTYHNCSSWISLSR